MSELTFHLSRIETTSVSREVSVKEEDFKAIVNKLCERDGIESKPLPELPRGILQEALVKAGENNLVTKSTSRYEKESSGTLTFFCSNGEQRDMHQVRVLPRFIDELFERGRALAIHFGKEAR